MRSDRSARWSRLLPFGVAAVLAVASCSSDDSTSTPTSGDPTEIDGTAAPASEVPAATDPPATDAPSVDTTVADSAPVDSVVVDEMSDCDVPDTTTPIDATAVGEEMSGDVSRDWDVTSFDGTVIRAHWFPIEDLADGETAPTVLMGPGWGSGGDTDVDTIGLLGSLSISSLRDAGYNVLTWDPRGFGESTGTVQIDSVDYEARDVQQLLDWVATQPQVELDGDGDPRSGMVGGSYGGGIQLVTAAIDCRVDALVPIVAWNSLITSLYKADTFKAGWSNLLATAAMTAEPRPDDRAIDRGRQHDRCARPGRRRMVRRTRPRRTRVGHHRSHADHPGHRRHPLHARRGRLQLRDAPGLGRTCRDDVVLRWARHLPVDGIARRSPRRHEERSTGSTGTSRVTSPSNWGRRSTSSTRTASTTRPTISRPPVRVRHSPATGAGELALVAEGGAGPAVAGEGGGVISQFSAAITPGAASNAVNVSTATAPPEGALVVGAPELTITYSGTTPDGVQPTRVFAQLVDPETGLVLGNQITPIEVVLDGASHTTTVPLEMVAHFMVAGSSLTLQIVATTVAYATPRLGGSVTFDAIDIALPVMTSAVANAG